jgi:hypothetical protein
MGSARSGLASRGSSAPAYSSPLRNGLARARMHPGHFLRGHQHWGSYQRLESNVRVRARSLSPTKIAASYWCLFRASWRHSLKNVSMVRFAAFRQAIDHAWPVVVQVAVGSVGGDALAHSLFSGEARDETRLRYLNRGKARSAGVNPSRTSVSSAFARQQLAGFSRASLCNFNFNFNFNFNSTTPAITRRSTAGSTKSRFLDDDPPSSFPRSTTASHLHLINHVGTKGSPEVFPARFRSFQDRAVAWPEESRPQGANSSFDGAVPYEMHCVRRVYLQGP